MFRKPGRGKDLVAAAALSSAMLLAGFLLLRSRGFLGESWSDGLRRFGSETAQGVRHAVWDVPEPYAALGEAADPALSPDGRWLVFVSGTRGLNAELFLAELVDGVPRDPRPLAELDTPADELAPAFDAGALYFASDRAGGAGGLDLWRAPFAEGRFGAAELLGPGLNSAADETDPAPVPGTRELVFASNRARADFDLYHATPERAAAPGRTTPSTDEIWVPTPLTALNSPGEEREPSFSSDPRSLTFASDRAGGAGGFDLYRALRFQDGWHAPEALPELGSAASERGPWLAADGFELWYARAGEGDDAGALEDGEPLASRLWHARSRELFRLPAPAVTLAQWLTLAALVALALLALLAKRWRALDILYRCLLVSLLLHLLLMLYLRAVQPEEKLYETGVEESPSFRVRLAPSEASTDERELEGLSGPTVPRRERFTPELARAEVPAAAHVEVPERAPEEAPAPARTPSPSTPAAALSPTIAEPREALPRYDAPVATLALDGALIVSRPSARRAESPTEPSRSTDAPQALGEVQPRAAQLAASEAAAADLAHGSPGAAALERVTSVTRAPELAAPSERFEPMAGSAPTLAFEATPARAQRDAPETPQRTSTAPAARATPFPERGAGELGPEARLVAALPEAPPSRAPLDEARMSAADLAREARTLRAPGAEPALPSSASPAFNATAGLAPETRERTARALRAPQRAPGDTASAAPPAAVPALALAAPPSSSETPEAPRIEPSQAPADSAEAGVELARALRAPENEFARGPTIASAPFDATAGLATSIDRPRATPASEPTRASEYGAVPAALPASAPSLAALPAATEAEALAPPEPEPMRIAGGPRTAPRSELRAPTGEATAQPSRATTSASFDAIAGLERAGAPARTRASTPERALADIPPSVPARPAAPVLPAAPDAAPAAAELGPQRALPPRLAETPYQNRFGAQKLRALEEFGGTRETEHAVAAGLEYLARIQDANGSWGQASDLHQKYLDVRVGKSALALLAFLGAGHVPSGDTQHAAVAERAVRYLIGEQDARTGHFGRSCSYGHGIATYALAECYALTRDARLEAPLERALAEILRNQNGGNDPRFAGGWGYYFADGHVWGQDEWPRTSVTAWQVMALESARLAGLEVPDPAFAGAREFLLHMWDPRARAFRYDHDPERLSSSYPILPASTPAALFALSLLGVDAGSDELAAARRFVLTRMPDGYRFTGNDDFVRAGRGNLYFWYYATLAMFRVGGKEWESWNGALKETLLPAQDADGSWRPLDIYAEYAGDEDEERTYTTAMCVLSLEVYYRYFTPLLRVR